MFMTSLKVVMVSLAFAGLAPNVPDAGGEAIFTEEGTPTVEATVSAEAEGDTEAEKVAEAKATFDEQDHAVQSLKLAEREAELARREAELSRREADLVKQDEASSASSIE
ncbi:hypothetical protein, partial [Fretibacterium fastidiosum]